MSSETLPLTDFRSKELNWNHKPGGDKLFNIFSRQGVKFIVAAEFEDYELISSCFLHLYNQVHPRLQKCLKTVAFPYDYFDHQTEGRIGKGGVPAGASLAGWGFIYIFGKDILINNKLDISLLILEHELLHLSSDVQEDKQFFGGPPAEYFEEYKMAMQKDVLVQKSLPLLPVHSRKFRPSKKDTLSRSFVYGGLAFNSGVKSYNEDTPTFIHEDWCETASFWLLQQRSQKMFAKLDIAKYYPHRIEVINKFLES